MSEEVSKILTALKKLKTAMQFYPTKIWGEFDELEKGIKELESMATEVNMPSLEELVETMNRANKGTSSAFIIPTSLIRPFAKAIHALLTTDQDPPHA